MHEIRVKTNANPRTWLKQSITKLQKHQLDYFQWNEHLLDCQLITISSDVTIFYFILSYVPYIISPKYVLLQTHYVKRRTTVIIRKRCLEFDLLLVVNVSKLLLDIICNCLLWLSIYLSFQPSLLICIFEIGETPPVGMPSTTNRGGVSMALPTSLVTSDSFLTWTKHYLESRPRPGAPPLGSPPLRSTCLCSDASSETLSLPGYLLYGTPA